MSAEEESDFPGHEEVRELMANGTLPPLVAVLRIQYPDVAADAEDAVYEAVTRFLAQKAKGNDVAKPREWIFVVAKNYLLKKLVRQANNEAELNEFATGSSRVETLEDDSYRYVKELVQRWESRRMREVTLLSLEAAYLGEPLSQQEAAEQVSLLLDEEVPWTSIGQTRARGFARLRAQIFDIAAQTGINPIDGNETS